MRVDEDGIRDSVDPRTDVVGRVVERDRDDREPL
jgi:hypothetical protein